MYQKGQALNEQRDVYQKNLTLKSNVRQKYFVCHRSLPQTALDFYIKFITVFEIMPFQEEMQVKVSNYEKHLIDDMKYPIKF